MRIVTTRYFAEAAADGTIVYVNLGSAQGVKVGDYFRVFRFQGNSSETEYQTPGVAYKIFGFGSAPPYSGAELPRDVLGEGVVLRVSKNAATVLITLSKKLAKLGSSDCDNFVFADPNQTDSICSQQILYTF